MVNVADRVVENLFSAHRLGIGEQMNEKKRAERHDARNLMQFAQKKSITEFDSHLGCFQASFGFLINI